MKDYKILLTFKNQFPNPQLLKSAHLKLLIIVNNSSYLLFLPPLPLYDWKFTGYYSIPYISCRIAVIGTPDYFLETLEKIPSFMKDLQG
jgi:hypothetical protein